MAKKKDQKKGVFCLEGPWFGVKDRTSMEPVLRLLETLKDYRVPYLHFDVGTREEFDFYLEKWAGASFRETHPILHLAFHGESGEIAVGEGRNTSVTLDDLAERLEGRCKGRVIHFCWRLYRIVTTRVVTIRYNHPSVRAARLRPTVAS